MSLAAVVEGAERFPAFPWILLFIILALLASLCRLYGWLRVSRFNRSRLFVQQLIYMTAASIFVFIGELLVVLAMQGNPGKYNHKPEHKVEGEPLTDVGYVCERPGETVLAWTVAHTAVSFLCSVFHVHSAARLLSFSLWLPWALGVLCAALQFVHLSDNDNFVGFGHWAFFWLVTPAFFITLLVWLAVVFVSCRPSSSPAAKAAARRMVPFFIGFLLAARPPVWFECPLVCQCYARLFRVMSALLNLAVYELVALRARRTLGDRTPSSGLRLWLEEWGTQQPQQESPCPSSSWFSTPEWGVLHVIYYMNGVDKLPTAIPGSSLMTSLAATSIWHQEGMHTSGRLAPLEDSPVAQRQLQGLLGSSPKSYSVAPAPDSLEELFVVERLLGVGSFGSVSLAVASMDYGGLASSQRYALKCITQSRMGELAHCVYRERDIMQQLSHPGIVALFASLQVDRPQPTWVLVMEYCAGGNLHQKLVREGQPGLPLPTVARLALETLQALSYLHSQDVLHRDISPANVLLTEAGRFKLSDFGLSTRGHRAGTLVGSPGYVAPEVFDAATYGTAADLYSWGAILELALTGSLRDSTSSSTWVVEGDQEQAMLGADLACRALSHRPEDRGSPTELLDHPFLQFAEQL